MIDILDRLQDEEGYVRLVLSSGIIVFGKPDCIVFDDEGDEVIKRIRFEPWNGIYAVYYGIDDIKEYDRIDEDDIPPSE